MSGAATGPKVLVITKLEAARRQIRLAVRLFFQREDPVVIHALACASVEVLRGIGRSRGIKSLFFDDEHVKEWIRPDRVDEWYRLLTEARNFFKHADRDAHSILDFYPETTPLHLMDACQMYRELAPPGFAEANQFLIWYMAKNPDVLIEGSPPRQALTELTAKLGAAVDDFELILEIIDARASNEEIRS